MASGEEGLLQRYFMWLYGLSSKSTSFFIMKMIYYLQYHTKRDNNLSCECLEATSEFLNEMIVQNSV